MTNQEERSITVDQTIYNAAAIRALLADRLRLEQQLKDEQQKLAVMKVAATKYSESRDRWFVAARQLERQLAQLRTAVHAWYDAVERGGFPGQLLGPHGRALAELAGITIEDQHGNTQANDTTDRPGEAADESPRITLV